MLHSANAPPPVVQCSRAVAAAMTTAEHGNMNTTQSEDQAPSGDTMRITVDFEFYVSAGMIGSAFIAAGSQS
jgi:hypothetical protein